MKKHNLVTAFMACLALTLVLNIDVSSSHSYFTTYVSAAGGYTNELHLVKTKTDETFDGGAKHITIQNIGEADCYVRVRVLSGLLVGLEYEDPTGNWVQDGEYWYYMPILKAGAESDELKAKITPMPGMDQNYNVVVEQECIPVKYVNGAAVPNGSDNPGWSAKAKEA